MLSHVADIPRMVRDAEAYLAERGVPNARRNAEWLLAHVLDCRSPDLYLSPYRVLDGPKLEEFQSILRRRGEREPLQYVLGSTEFMSLPFRVRRGVFIPRPETEILVEKIESLLSRRAVRRGGESSDTTGNDARTMPGSRVTVLDLCCGTGVIGISLARRIPRCESVCVEIDGTAVALSRENADLNGVGERVRCVEADAARFVSGEPRAFDVVACNPPYVATAEIASLLPEVRAYEPVLGLDGGADGLRIYRELVPLLPGALASGGILALEIGDSQAGAVTELLESSSFVNISVDKDYRGLDRVVTARKP
jgi:release factor glutamine methyltransferase